MTYKDNYLQTVELAVEQNTNIIDGIINNTPPPVSAPKDRPLDRATAYQ